MESHSLTLVPFNNTQSFDIELMEGKERSETIEQLVVEQSEINGVFSDISYEFVLNYYDISQIKDVQIFINDFYESSTFENGKISFPDKDFGERRIFIDCYGFVQLSINIIMLDGTEKSFCSKYLPVIVHPGHLNDAIKKMVDYVYKHNESLLLNGEIKARNYASLKDHGYKSLEAQIIIAEEIALVYEACYGYFKSNSRSRIEKIPCVDNLERIKYINSATLNYIASHPEQLRRTNSNVGVIIRNRGYQPQKAMFLQSVNSHDIYENKVVLGFLQKIIIDLDVLKNNCKNLLSKIPSSEKYNSEYIYSSFFVFSETKKSLEKSLERLSVVYEKFLQLLKIYNNALKIDAEILLSNPKPTDIFLSVSYYNKIFVRIHKWLDSGIYDFNSEKAIFSFIKISNLYESYLLIKFISYFTECGYSLVSSNCFKYPPTSAKWKYNNTKCLNTFSFFDGTRKINLYYQPVIYTPKQSNQNGISLYRNNSIPSNTGDNDDNKYGGSYYAPDYIIEFENGLNSKYLIIDAKFSEKENVRKYYIKELIFKYLFSLSPTDCEHSIMGLCIFYGKCNEDEITQSAFDKQKPNAPIIPFVDIVPLIEGVSQKDHINRLDLIMKKYLL